MTGGFTNPIIGGGGALVYPSVHSPDYAAASAGWSINKDGSAEFNNVTVRGLIEGATGLYYSGSPAAGNLVVSIDNSTGTDIYNNAILPGVVTYGAFGGGTLGEMLAQQTEAGKTTWYSAPSYSGPWTQFAALNPNNTAAAGYTVLTGQPLLLPSATAIAPGTTATPETWHPMSLNAGWAAGAGYATPSYRLTSGGDVELCGRIVGTSIANGQGIASLPAGYYGATIYQASPAVISAAAAPSGGGTFRVQLGTGGGLVIAGLSATGNYTFQLDGVIIPVSQG